MENTTTEETQQPTNEVVVGDEQPNENPAEFADGEPNSGEQSEKVIPQALTEEEQEKINQDMEDMKPVSEYGQMYSEIEAVATWLNKEAQANKENRLVHKAFTAAATKMQGALIYIKFAVELTEK